MTPEETMVISATVVTDDHEQATRAAEVLARAATGLVLDGVSVSLALYRADDPEDDDDHG